MKKWEYKMISLSSVLDLKIGITLDLLNEFGNKGWEVQSFQYLEIEEDKQGTYKIIFCLKREKEEETKPKSHTEEPKRQTLGDMEDHTYG